MARSSLPGHGQHAGDCTIYSSLINGMPYDGICTCGFGRRRMRAGDFTQMLSAERFEQPGQVADSLDLLTLLGQFRARVIGTRVRHQAIEGVELLIDDLTESGTGWRYVLTVIFAENPTTDQSPVQNLLERVYSEIPVGARLATKDLESLVAVLRGDAEPIWYLDDEIPPIAGPHE